MINSVIMRNSHCAVLEYIHNLSTKGILHETPHFPEIQSSELKNNQVISKIFINTLIPSGKCHFDEKVC